MGRVNFDRPCGNRAAPQTCLTMLTSALAIAATMALPASAYAAGAFAGTPSGLETAPGRFEGAGYVVDRGAASDTITLKNSTAVITWTPTDVASGSEAINFLPTGNLAVFVNDASHQGDYTVLNRIVPNDSSRAVEFNGIVNSFRRDANGNDVQGGNIWFYSPGGVLIGSNAQFNIGSLLLTTGDPSRGGSIDPTGSFTMASAPGARIAVESGANISAVPTGSYVAMIAPSVVQSGTVLVNGSAAYVAAEAVEMKIDQGLFDIAVSTGSAHVVEHGGTTRWMADNDSPANRKIYLVSVPKNEAMAMVLGGGTQLGYDVATAAQTEGTAIILSAGHNISDGSIGTRVASSPDADIVITGGTFNADVVAKASGESRAVATSGTTAFNADLSLTGGRARLGALTGGTLDIRGAATLATTSSYVPDQGEAANVEAFAETGGRLVIGDGLTVTADATQTVSATPIKAGNAIVRSDSGGLIDVTGSLRVTANAFSASSAGGSFIATSVEGGAVQLLADGGAIAVSSETVAHAPGVADSSGSAAADGTGGHVTIRASNDGTIAMAEGLYADVEGSAVDNGNVASFGGSGQGGTITLLASGGSIETGGYTGLYAGGYGVAINGGEIAGAGRGGTIALTADAGGSLSLNDLTASVTADGGRIREGDGSGGRAEAGRIDVNASGSGSRIDLGGVSQITAQARGGSSSSGIGGDAWGGTVGLTAADDAVLSAEGLDLQDIVLAGAGQRFGDATGGTFTLSASDRASIVVDNSLLFNAGLDEPSLTGRTAIGSHFGIAVTDSASLTVGGNVSADLSAYGATSGDGGGDATGGTALITVRDVGRLQVDGTVAISADGRGGENYEADGGRGNGGVARIAMTGGHFAAQSVSLQANGFGGAGDQAGRGTGGQAGIGITGGSAEIGEAFIAEASGEGGFGFNGGDGLGGDATLHVAGGSFAILDASEAGGLRLIADGRGGAAGSAFGEASVGQGGRGQGGAIYVHALAGDGGSTVSSDVTTLLADGYGGEAASAFFGGAGGAGGDAQGGEISVKVDGGEARTQLGSTRMSASATAADGADASSFGGSARGFGEGGDEGGEGSGPGEDGWPSGGFDGGTGGAAHGGHVTIALVAGDAELQTGELLFGDLFVDASARAGRGGSTVSGFEGNGGIAGDGGPAYAGQIEVRVPAGRLSADTAEAWANAYGGSATGEAVTGNAVGGLFDMRASRATGVASGGRIEIDSLVVETSALQGEGPGIGEQSAGRFVLAAAGNESHIAIGTADFSAYGADIAENALPSEIAGEAGGSVALDGLTITSDGDVAFYRDGAGGVSASEYIVAARRVTNLCVIEAGDCSPAPTRPGSVQPPSDGGGDDGTTPVDPPVDPQPEPPTTPTNPQPPVTPQPPVDPQPPIAPQPPVDPGPVAPEPVNPDPSPPAPGPDQPIPPNPPAGPGGADVPVPPTDPASPASPPTVPRAVLLSETAHVSATIRSVADERGAAITRVSDTSLAPSAAESRPKTAQADEDDGDVEDTAQASSAEVGPSGYLIDTRSIAGGHQGIDAPVMSSGNSSLWTGADGIAADDDGQ